MAIYHLNVKVGSKAKGQSAKAKSDYISRDGKYQKDKDELVHSESSHMPEWARQDPTRYWEAADTHERKNGSLYREVEFALPVELDRDAQIKLAHEFAETLTAEKNMPYTLAIHRGKDQNPHCHLMISERMNDGIDRTPETWFKRAANAGTDPATGGARKAVIGENKKVWLEQTREAWADAANLALEQAGEQARIDHRSYADQGIEKVPGVHLGPHVIEMENKGIETDRAELLAEVTAANIEMEVLYGERHKIAERYGADYTVESVPEIEPGFRQSSGIDAGRNYAGLDSPPADVADVADGHSGGDLGAAPEPRRHATKFGRSDASAEERNRRADNRDYSPRDPGHGRSHNEMAREFRADGQGSGEDPELSPEHGQSLQRTGPDFTEDRGFDLEPGRIDRRLKPSSEATREQPLEDRSDNGLDNVPDHDFGHDRDALDMGPDPIAMAWNSRFKKASAARKRQQEARPKPVSSTQKQDARAVDPRQFFEAAGLEVRQRQGQDEYSVCLDGAELYRSTLTGDHWVHCHHDRTGIGDNIAMIQELDSGKSFIDAVYELHGAPSFGPQPTPRPVQIRKPTMPPCNAQAQAKGREYLQERGISPEIIAKAEQAGAIAYTLDGVLVVGRDPQTGEIRSITRRAFDPSADVQKRDIKYSNKADFPAILPGDDSKGVVIVEGGVDALAVQEMQRRHSGALPTVIIAGTAKAIAFLDRPHVQAILAKAELVTVCYENEARSAVQQDTDAGHDRQVDKIRELIPEDSRVQQYRPPRRCKDIADHNKRDVDQARAKAQAQAAAAREKALQRHRDRPARATALGLEAKGYDYGQIKRLLGDDLQEQGWHKDTASAYATVTANEVCADLDPAETLDLCSEIKSAEMQIRQADQAETIALVEQQERPGHRDKDKEKEKDFVQDGGPGPGDWGKAIPTGTMHGASGKTPFQARVDAFEAKNSAARDWEEEQRRHGMRPH